MSDILNVEKIKKTLNAFAKERDWQKFHSPKNICMALASEVGELTEIFQWLTEEDSRSLTQDVKKLKMVEEEIADIILYAVLISAELGINVEEAILNKIKENAKKYPAHLVKGSAKKYTEY